MNPADRLIVALDVPVDDAFDLVRRLRYQARFFKIGVGALLAQHGLDLAHYIIDEGNDLFLDIKLYDTRDTVARVLTNSFGIGARFVTVHARSVPAALAAIHSSRQTVLAVDRLTDEGGGVKPFGRSVAAAGGIVCHPLTARWHREDLGPNKIIVCPGIRPTGRESHNHTVPSTPGGAIRNGADYLVVGRPIYAASDPVEAARAITREIEVTLTPEPAT